MAISAINERVLFAQQLRGIAALCVVWLHLGVNYWLGQGFVHQTMGIPLPPVIAPTPPWWAQITHLLQTFGSDRPYIDVGAFGVALFFLISGFVIPISLNRLGPLRFFWARLIRIYPVYWVGLLLWFVSWELTAWYFGQATGGAPKLPMWQWVAHFFMVGDWWGLAPIDLVSWTLQIELKFYLVIALCYTMVRRLELHVVWLFWGLVLAAGGLNFFILRNGIWTGLNSMIWFVLNQNLKQLGFVGYIFSGYVLYLYWRGRLGRGLVLANMLAIQLAFILIMQFSGVKGNALKVLVLSQMMASVVFVGAMSLSWQRMRRFLGFLANISYPLYMVHLVVGWMGLALCARLDWPPSIVLPLVLMLVVAVAWAVHRIVEQPSLMWLDHLKREPNKGG